jgi:hypothetical protein
MDDAVQRFRRQAGRELGDREGAERRYSVGLRQQAVAHWRVREAAGDGVRAVAMALGVAPVSSRRWAQDARFRPVRLVEGVDIETGKRSASAVLKAASIAAMLCGTPWVG